MSSPKTPSGRLVAVIVFVIWSSSLPVLAENVKWKRVKPVAPQRKLTRPPKLLTFVKAKYPKQALLKGIQGSVRLTLVIDRLGRVVKATVALDPGYGLGRAALGAAKKFRFRPALVNNKPASVRLRYTYHFRLQRRKAVTKPTVLRKSGAELRGRLFERGTRLPIGSAALAIPKLKLEVLSDKQGHFRFAHVPPGRHQIVVYSVSHRTIRRSVVVKPGVKTLNVVLRVDRLITSRYEVIVIGRRPVRGLSRKTLQKEELRTIPGTFGDPLRAIQTFPGVARPPYLSGQLIVRGASPQNSSIFVDGHVVPLIYHFLGGPSVLNASFLQRIDFMPGNFSVRYGRTLAGIIDVRTSRPKIRRWGGDLNVSLFDSSLYVTGPITKKVTIAMSARRSYIDLVIPLVLSRTSFAVVLPVYYDYQLRLDIDLGSDDRLSIFGFGSDDQLRVRSRDQDSRNPTDLDSQVGFHRINVKWLKNFGNKWRFMLSPIVGLDIAKLIENEGTEEETSLDMRVWEAALRFDVTHTYSKKLRFDFGIDLLYRHTTSSTQKSTPVNFRPPPEYYHSFSLSSGGDVEQIKRRLGIFSGAFYLESMIQPFSWWTLVFGMRLNFYHTPAREMVRFDPRMNMAFKVTKKATIKLGAGLFSQPPLATYLDPTYGNPDLVPAWAEHYSLGFEYRFTRYFRIEWVAFYIHTHNQVRRTRDVVTRSDGTPRALRYSQNREGESFGMELLVRHDPYKWFYGWVSYTLMRSQEQEFDGTRYITGFYDQTHILHVVASFRLGRGWEIGIRFRGVSGRPQTNVAGGTFNADNFRYISLWDRRLTSRRPFFHQLDFRVEKTWKFNLWQLQLYLDVQNVYFAKNVEAIRYDYRKQETQKIPGIPILPSLGVRGKF